MDMTHPCILTDVKWVVDPRLESPSGKGRQSAYKWQSPPNAAGASRDVPGFTSLPVGYQTSRESCLAKMAVIQIWLELGPWPHSK